MDFSVSAADLRSSSVAGRKTLETSNLKKRTSSTIPPARLPPKSKGKGKKEKKPEKKEEVKNKAQTTNNTLQLGPRMPFDVYKVEHYIKSEVDRLIEEFEFVTYDPEVAKKITMKLSVRTLRFANTLQLDRRKFAVYADVLQNTRQDVRATLKFLWDFEYDNYAQYFYKTPEYMIYAIMIVIYCD